MTALASSLQELVPDTVSEVAPFLGAPDADPTVASNHIHRLSTICYSFCHAIYMLPAAEWSAALQVC